MDDLYTIDEIDAISGEIVSRDFTDDEMADRLAEISYEQAEAKAKADARQSALAKLAALGLTQEEIEALV